MATPHLSVSLDHLPAHVWESMAVVARDVLLELETTIQQTNGIAQITEAMLGKIQKVKAEDCQPETVIAFFGDSGSGKSTAINALLGFDVLPTSSHAVCTAAHVEVRYGENFLAEIEFDTKAHLAAQIPIMKEEATETCTTGEDNHLKKIALAKLKALCPELTEAKIKQTLPETLEKLLDHPCLEYLGTTRVIESQALEPFRRVIEHYIMNTAQDDGVPTCMFVKSARLHVPSPMLKNTRMVLVDNPGARDTNAVRVGISRASMRSCDHLVIIAPLNRALENRTVHDLLSDSVQLFLTMDGKLDCFTIVCTKSDDMKLDEVRLHNAPSEFFDLKKIFKDHKSKRVHIRSELKKLTNTSEKTRDRLEEVQKDLESWKALHVEAMGGRNVYDPRESRSGNQKLSGLQPHKPLTIQQIRAKVAELQQQLEGQNTVQSSVLQLELDIRKIFLEEEEIERKMRSMAIVSRNVQTTSQLKQEIAKCICEINNNAMLNCREKEIFPHGHQFMNYEVMAQNLPVFAISADGYRTKLDLTTEDHDALGFKSVKDTQIPQLEKHLQSLTVKKRTASSKMFLSAFQQLVYSLAIQYGSDCTPAKGLMMRYEVRQRMTSHVDNHFIMLQDKFLKSLSLSFKHISSMFNDKILTVLWSGVDDAVNCATTTASLWSALYHPTYKAICRRGGSNFKHHDWNYQLVSPMLLRVVMAWKNVFGHAIPLQLVELKRSAVALLQTFHEDVTTNVTLEDQEMELLNQQLLARERLIRATFYQLQRTHSIDQHNIHYEFVHSIELAMAPAYLKAACRWGLGSYPDMKSDILSHIERVRNNMFHECAQNTSDLLDKFADDIKKDLELKMKDVFMNVKCDYLATLVKDPLPISQTEFDLHAKIMKIAETVPGRLDSIRQNGVNKILDKDMGHVNRSVGHTSLSRSPSPPVHAYSFRYAIDQNVDEETPPVSFRIKGETD